MIQYATRRFGVALMIGGLVLAAGAGAVHAQADSPDQQALIRSAGKSLVFAAPGGDLGKILKSVLADFTQQTGIRVNYLEGPLLDLYGRIKAERNRPSIDVYVASSVTEAKGIQEGTYQALDPKIVTNLRQVGPIGRVPGDMGVRQGLTNLGILYNRKFYEDNKIPLPRRWEDIWSPAVKNRVILGDTTSFYTVLYIAYLTKTHGGDVSNPEAGIDYLAKRKNNLLAVVRTYPERMQMLTSGQAWLTVDVGMTSVPQTRKNPDLAFLTPEDGSPLFWNAYTVVKGAPNPVGAQLLINFLISEPIQARLARESFLGPVNSAVKIEGDLAKQIPYGKSSIDRLVALDSGAIAESIGRYRELWNAKMVTP